ncbi:DUF397 domain-containing protein [Streptomyces kanamyceticus]|uniref:DUF397 domain-containing protein n=1 Tax=Streptomyces kanamyceticus TaxID=1967 RepID=A0A5J6GEY3_STRKN|nr:DUF397 domain-containing protein [Streptomyces kanamyceticus]QEU93032.1 DUF397 domain-containing protein [Streptomyces kanamyceticus]
MTPALHWQKSTFSDGGDGNTCVELAATGPQIHIRESDTPTTELLTSPATLASLLRTLKARGR